MAPRVRNRHIPSPKSTANESKFAGIAKHVNDIVKPSGNCSFSLKYLFTNDPTFLVEHEDAEYYHKIIERLKALSTSSVLELRANRSPALRCHPIDWKDTRVSRSSFGIPQEEELYDTPYEISVSSNEYGRMHGFFTGDIFNIVWLDRNHDLYA